jgi:hypothetical protein
LSKHQVIQQGAAYGSQPALLSLIDTLPDDVSVVVKDGVGDWLPVAATHGSNAGIYLNRRYLHVILDPEDARSLVADTGFRLSGINNASGYVKVTTEEADGPHRERLVREVERALRRSADSVGGDAGPRGIRGQRPQRLCPETWEEVPVSGVCDLHGLACA